MDCSLPGTSVLGDSPGKNTGIGCHALLQGIFPTQKSNPGLLHCRRVLYHLSHQGSLIYLNKYLKTVKTNQSIETLKINSIILVSLPLSRERKIPISWQVRRKPILNKQKRWRRRRSSKAMCSVGRRWLISGMQRGLEVIGLSLEEPSGAHLEHVNLTSHSIQPAWLSSFLSLQEIQSNKSGSVKGAVRGSTLTVARKDVPALKAESGDLWHAGWCVWKAKKPKASQS